MSHSAALFAAGLVTVALAVVHALSPHLRRRSGSTGEAVLAAVGGGVAVTYVFLHLIPELARGSEAVKRLFGESGDASAVEELLVFVVALVGFLVLYGLDHLAERRGHGGAVFGVHIGAYAIYNAVIGYSLPTQFEVGPSFAALFAFAMAVHFVLSDRSLEQHYGERFERIGRPVVVGALVVGFVTAWALAPTNSLVVSLLLAALAGFVLYNVFRDELPSDADVRFPAFATSAAVYAVLLVVLTAIGH